MKLTKKEKQRLIGKKIVVDRVLRKNNEIDWEKSGIFFGENIIREIETIKLSNSIKAVIVGFTHLCQGKFICDSSGGSFICKKRIPCMKIATGIVGKIQYAPIRLRPSTLLSICERRGKK